MPIMGKSKAANGNEKQVIASQPAPIARKSKWLAISEGNNHPATFYH